MSNYTASSGELEKLRQQVAELEQQNAELTADLDRDRARFMLAYGEGWTEGYRAALERLEQR